MKDWSDLLGGSDSPYLLRLGQEAGTRFPAKPPYPDLEVVEADEVYVRRWMLQRLVVAADTPEDDDVQHLEIVRLVAEIEGGEEIEVHRTVEPLKEAPPEPLDTSRCEACGGKLLLDDMIVIGEKRYHKRCVIADDEKPHVPRRRIEEVE